MLLPPYFLIHLFCIIKKYKFITVSIYFVWGITNFNQHASMNQSMIKNIWLHKSFTSEWLMKKEKVCKAINTFSVNDAKIYMKSNW